VTLTLTISVKVVVRVTPPPNACIVMSVDEFGAVAEAMKVIVALHVGLQLGGVNALAVTPGGSGLPIASVKCGVTPATKVTIATSTPPGPPEVMVNVVGEAARAISQTQPTTSVNVAV